MRNIFLLLFVLGIGVFSTTLYFLSVIDNNDRVFKKERDELHGELVRIGDSLASTTIRLEDISLALEATERDALHFRAERDILENELGKLGVLNEQIRSLTSTVGDLEKLKELDRELLKKYSKTYFLNEHYLPKKLSLIEKGYVLHPAKDYFINSDVLPFLEELMEKARGEGIDIEILSGYRSFESQAELKSQYTVTFGSGANQFAADQGYSEHQLGTAVDFTTSEGGELLSGFKDTGTYKWLVSNAHEFGFILSYPEGNEYYFYEPWHWRFVGRKLSWKIYSENLNFYSFDQRKLDEYLINIFD